MVKLINEEFIKKAKAVLGDKYDYSKVVCPFKRESMK